jgi:hypothetical protein
LLKSTISPSRLEPIAGKFTITAVRVTLHPARTGRLWQRPPALPDAFFPRQPPSARRLPSRRQARSVRDTAVKVRAPSVIPFENASRCVGRSAQNDSQAEVTRAGIGAQSSLDWHIASSFTDPWFRSTRDHSPGSGIGKSLWLIWGSNPFEDFPSGTGAGGCFSDSINGHCGQSSRDTSPGRIPSPPWILPSYSGYPGPAFPQIGLRRKPLDTQVAMDG